MALIAFSGALAVFERLIVVVGPNGCENMGDSSSDSKQAESKSLGFA